MAFARLEGAGSSRNVNHGGLSLSKHITGTSLLFLDMEQFAKRLLSLASGIQHTPCMSNTMDYL